MFKFLLTKFRSLKFKNQVLIINMLIIFPTMILAGLFSYIEVEIVLNISSNSSAIIMEYQDRRQVRNIAKYVSRSIEYKHQQVVCQLRSIQLFELFYQEHYSQFSNLHEVSSCVTLNQYNADQGVFSIPRFCYQANGVPDSLTLPVEDTSLQQLHRVISLLDYYSLVIDNFEKGIFQIASMSKTKYFVQFPHALLIRSYDITQRPWFINHIAETKQNSKQLLVYTTLHQYSQTDQLEIAASFSLLGDKQSLIGIVKQSLLVASNLIPSVAYNVIMLDSQGIVLLHQIEQTINISVPFYIYNQSLTGFNMTDWINLKKALNQQQSEQLILFNKFYNQSVNVNVSKLKSNNFTLMMYFKGQFRYSNVTTTNDFKLILLLFLDKIKMKWMIVIAVEIAFQLIFILIQSVIITIIFRPLKELSTMVRYHSLSLGNNFTSIIFKMANSSAYTDLISQLRNKMLNLSEYFFTSGKKKCAICKELEELPNWRVENNLTTLWIKEKNILLTNRQKSFLPQREIFKKLTHNMKNILNQ